MTLAKVMIACRAKEALLCFRDLQGISWNQRNETWGEPIVIEQWVRVSLQQCCGGFQE